MASTVRTLYDKITPHWLHVEGDGPRVLFALASVIDASIQRLRDGLDARFPSRTGESALELISRDRGMIRGRTEAAAHFAERLKRWRSPFGHRVRGNAFALLEQVSEYFGGLMGWTFDTRGTVDSRTAVGAVATEYGNTLRWDAACADPLQWSRFWVVVDGSGMFETQYEMGDVRLYGGDLGSQDYALGLRGFAPADARAMRRLLYRSNAGAPWRPAGTQPEWLIISLDGTNPLDGSGPAPASDWGTWSTIVAGVQTPIRPDAYRYVSLDVSHNNEYAGLREYPAEIILMSGVHTTGSDTVWNAYIELTEGTQVVGDPDIFPATIPLVDDGDWL